MATALRTTPSTGTVRHVTRCQHAIDTSRRRSYVSSVSSPIECRTPPQPPASPSQVYSNPRRGPSPSSAEYCTTKRAVRGPQLRSTHPRLVPRRRCGEDTNSTTSIHLTSLLAHPRPGDPSHRKPPPHRPHSNPKFTLARGLAARKGPMPPADHDPIHRPSRPITIPHHANIPLQECDHRSPRPVTTRPVRPPDAEQARNTRA